MWLLNLGKPVEVPKLNENQAIELGANILGEGIIFAIAALILILEYRRQVAKETAKETKRIEEFDRLVNIINEVYFDNQKNQAEIKELTRHVHYLEKELRKFPPSPPKGEDPPIKNKKIEEVPKESLSPSNISFEHGNNQVEQIASIRSRSIMSAISYLEHEVISPDKSDKYIEQEDSGLVLSALEYLDSEVFKNNQENDVIIVLRNAPYASHAYY